MTETHTSLLKKKKEESKNKDEDVKRLEREN